MKEKNVDKVNYDLEERTSLFAENVIDFAKTIPQNPVTMRLISQLVGAASSVGANYMEANAASSKKDFRNKISICRKEAKEAGFFLRCVAKACPDRKDKSRELWKESHELVLIFSKIFRSSSEN